MSHGGKDKPRWRSKPGCCICETKSSSSRFTQSNRYSTHFEGCFGPAAANRSGEMCNACVLCVKRWLKQEPRANGYFAKVLGSKKGAGPKHQKEIEKRRRKREKECSNGSTRSVLGNEAGLICHTSSLNSSCIIQQPSTGGCSLLSVGASGIYSANCCNLASTVFAPVNLPREFSNDCLVYHKDDITSVPDGVRLASNTAASTVFSTSSSNLDNSLDAASSSGDVSFNNNHVCNAVNPMLEEVQVDPFNKPLPSSRGTKRGFHTSTPYRRQTRSQQKKPLALSGNIKLLHAGKGSGYLSDDEEDDDFDANSTFSELHHSSSSSSLFQHKCPTCHGVILDADSRRFSIRAANKLLRSNQEQQPCPRHPPAPPNIDLGASGTPLVSGSNEMTQQRKYNRRVQLPPLKMENSPEINKIYELIMAKKLQSFDHDGNRSNDKMLMHMRLQSVMRRSMRLRTAATATTSATAGQQMSDHQYAGEDSACSGACSPPSTNNKRICNQSGNTTLANTSGYGSELGWDASSSVFDEASGSFMTSAEQHSPNNNSSGPRLLGDKSKVCQCRCTCAFASELINGAVCSSEFVKPERRKTNSSPNNIKQ